MNHYYVIGIGGVGSRILEGVVRLCECGYISPGQSGQGPSEITCLMIDADAQCGNTFQTTTLLQNYEKTRDCIGGGGGAIFKTELKGVEYAPGSRTFVTSPIDEAAFTIESNVVGYSNRAAYNFMTAAYDVDEYEKMDVTDGFYGRPTIGSLVFAWRTESSGVINKLINEIGSKTLAEGDKVYVYLLASLFGGTGASGLPTIANAIKGHAANRDNLHMAACLMLPYFSYDKDTVPGDQAKIDHANFAANAQNAINYYRNQMENNIFDQVHMVGDPEKPVRGVYADRGGAQLNMPNVLELFAAAEVKKFFDSDPPAGAYQTTTWYAGPYFLEGDYLQDLTWNDYGSGEALQEYIENFILFNYYYSMYVVPWVFDFEGKAGKYFGELRKFDGEVAFNLPDWLYNGNFATYKWVFKSWGEAVAKLKLKQRSFSHWGGEDIPRSSFETLFKYLTESANWYFNMVYEYHDNSKTCYKCDERTCGDSFAGKLASCLEARIMLPGLFGESGAKMLARRASLPGWLSKLGSGQADLFRKEAEIFARDTAQSALIDRRDCPIAGFYDGINLGRPNSMDDAFYELVDAIYEKSCAITKITN